MPKNLSYADDLAETIDEAAGRKPEYEAAAEAVWSRLQTDRKFAQALRRLLPKPGARKPSHHMMEDDPDA